MMASVALPIKRSLARYHGLSGGMPNSREHRPWL